MLDDEEIAKEILQNTATIEERTRKIEDEVSGLTSRYVDESKRRDERLSEVETRVDRHDVVLSGGVAAFLALLAAAASRVAGILSF